MGCRYRGFQIYGLQVQGLPDLLAAGTKISRNYGLQVHTKSFRNHWPQVKGLSDHGLQVQEVQEIVGFRYRGFQIYGLKVQKVKKKSLTPGTVGRCACCVALKRPESRFNQTLPSQLRLSLTLLLSVWSVKPLHTKWPKNLHLLPCIFKRITR